MPEKHVGRAGVSCLVAALVFCAPGGYAENFTPSGISPDVFTNRSFEVAQLLQPPASSDEDTESAVPTSEPAEAEAPGAATDETEDGSFVFAGDLARQLRKIDPDAKVEWNGQKLLIRANDQEFAVFPTGQEMVINGDIESDTPPLKIRNGEIYVPQDVIARIGRQLESGAAPTDAVTTAPVTGTPTPAPTVTPTPDVTPGMSILPDTTPEIATPTPRGTAATPISVLPDLTPAPTAAVTATATPADVAATPEATPFPRATPTPTPAPTPTPTPTPQPVEDEEQDADQQELTLSTESFKAALRDKVSVSTHDLAVFSMAQLEKLAQTRSVNKVVIHPDESGLERTDKYGKEAAKISLEISRRLKTHLDGAGIETVLTRDSEDGITIGESMETITKSGAQVLVVVSVGYSTTFQDLGGYRVFFMNESVDYSSLHPRTFDASEAVPAELNYRPFQNASKVLASSVKNSINAALDREPVGTNPAPLYQVRRAPMAAAAVVVGYLSNPADAQRLTDTAEQDAMAKALAEGIQNFANQVSQGKAASDASGEF